MRALLPLLALIVASAAPARATNLRVDYSITLAGLSIGDADLSGTFDEARYDMSMSARLTGIAGALSGGSKGGATARGAVSGSRLMSTGFSATGRQGDFTRTVQVGVHNGNVTSVAIAPPFEERPDRVPVTDANRRGIVDPLSAMVGLASVGLKPEDPANCNRTLPVFDGAMRFNVVLSYSGTRVVSKPGFSGPVLVCAIRWVPIAGHRPERAVVKFMQESRDMSVWVAPVPGTRLLIPIRIQVATTVGTSVIEAQRWRVE